MGLLERDGCPSDSIPSCEIRLSAAPPLNFTAVPLAFEAALSRGTGGARWPAPFRWHRRLADQRHEALDRVAAVHVLAAESVRRDDQHAVPADAIAASNAYPLAHRRGQRRRARDVEAQLH